MPTGKTVHQRGWHGCSLMSARLQRLRGKQKGLTLQSPAIVLRGQAHLLRAEPAQCQTEKEKGSQLVQGHKKARTQNRECRVCYLDKTKRQMSSSQTL